METKQVTILINMIQITITMGNKVLAIMAEVITMIMANVQVMHLIDECS